MKDYIFLLVFLGTCSFLFAGRGPSLYVPEDPDNPDSGLKPLQITVVHTEVTIHGHLAQTAMTLTFRNNSNRRLEGNLRFPLPANSIITGYALDIGSEMVEGVAVEKERGRQVFEAIKAQRIDPGLLEWENRDCFKTRIFPIPDNSSRTITVKYLTDIKDGNYLLPLGFSEEIPDFKLMVSVIQAESFPKIERGKFEGFKFVEKENNSIAKFSAEYFCPEEDLKINIPRKTTDSVIVEQAPDKKLYFCINTTPIVLDNTSKIVPENVSIFWDASGSRAKSFQKDCALLRDYFYNSKKNIKVKLIVFRNKLEKPVSFTIKDGRSYDLITYLKKLEYDGATQLGLVKQDQEKPSFYMLFTDGMSTLGDGEIGTFNAPVYAVSSGDNTNKPLLQQLSAASGGVYIDLSEERNPKEKIGTLSFNFISAEYPEGQFENVYPNYPVTIKKGDFSITGEMLKYKGKIKLNFGLGKKVMQTREFSVSANFALKESIIYKFQALKKLDQLIANQEHNMPKIVALGKKYGLVTPGTSLIVLESLSQYLQYKIPPPMSSPKLRKRYFDNLKYYTNRRRSRKEDNFNAIIKRWQKRMMWWNTDFIYKKGFKFKPFYYYNTFDDDEEEGSFGMDDDFSLEDTFGDEGGGGRRFARRKVSPVTITNLGREAKPKNPQTILIKQAENFSDFDRNINLLSADTVESLYKQRNKGARKTPAYYLAFADFYARKGDKQKGIRIVTNLLEKQFDNLLVLRVLAYKLKEYGDLDTAIMVLQQALSMKPDDYKIMRELALVYIKRGDQAQDEKKKKTDYQQAINLLSKVVAAKKAGSLVELAVMDINHLKTRAKAVGISNFKIPAILLKTMDADLRIVITPFSNAHKVNFTIQEPSGERANSWHPLTLIGGYMSGGMGAEAYVIRKAMPGKYAILTNVRKDSAIDTVGALIVHMDVYTNYNRKSEQHRSIIYNLNETAKNVELGSITFGE